MTLKLKILTGIYLKKDGVAVGVQMQAAAANTSLKHIRGDE